MSIAIEKHPPDDLLFQNISNTETNVKMNEKNLNSNDEEIGEMRELFSLLDKDNSGFITTEEFADSLHAFGQIMDLSSIKEMINKIDGDNNQHIDFEEFCSMMKHESTTTITQSELKKYFQAFDDDCSGYITTAEFCRMMNDLGHEINDDKMDAISNFIDADGNGQCTLKEFGTVLVKLGFEVLEDDDTDNELFNDLKLSTVTKKKESENDSKPIPFNSEITKALLAPVTNDDGQINASDLQRAMELLELEKSLGAKDPASNKALHWDPKREKRGLGEVLYKANHIAVIVSDVARSAAFYSDVVGLQQIRRPDFDRHGAWFTMGNLELHLIKGNPIVHSGDDLIVGHISLETYDIDRVPEILKAKGISFEQNVSVPKGAMAEGSGTNDSSDSSGIVKQYFFRDPDGYYLEVCNCDVLTSYCLGEKETLIGYDDGVAPINIQDASLMQLIALRLSKKGRVEALKMKQLMDTMKGMQYEEIAKALGTNPSTNIDDKKLRALIIRRSVYGDICQSETEEGLRKLLLLSGNNVQTVVNILTIHFGDTQVFKPPAFYDQRGTKIIPEAFKVPTRDNCTNKRGLRHNYL